MTNGEMWLKPKGEIWEKVKCDKGEYFSSSKAKLPQKRSFGFCHICNNKKK